MNIDRLALNLRAYAHSRGAPQREDDQEAAMLAASQIAQAMEARSGETRSGSTEGDSAVAKPCAQDPSGSNRHG